MCAHMNIRTQTSICILFFSLVCVFFLSRFDLVYACVCVCVNVCIPSFDDMFVVPRWLIGLTACMCVNSIYIHTSVCLRLYLIICINVYMQVHIPDLWLYALCRWCAGKYHALAVYTRIWDPSGCVWAYVCVRVGEHDYGHCVVDFLENKKNENITHSLCSWLAYPHRTWVHTPDVHWHTYRLRMGRTIGCCTNSESISPSRGNTAGTRAYT